MWKEGCFSELIGWLFLSFSSRENFCYVHKNSWTSKLLHFCSNALSFRKPQVAMKFKIMVPRFWTSDSSTVIVLAFWVIPLSVMCLCVCKMCLIIVKCTVNHNQHATSILVKSKFEHSRLIFSDLNLNMVDIQTWNMNQTHPTRYMGVVDQCQNWFCLFTLWVDQGFILDTTQ